MKSNQFFLYLFCCAFAVTDLAAATDTASSQPDLFLLSRFSPLDYRTAALAGAGCAVLSGSNSAVINPALPHRSNVMNEIERLTASFGYGRDSVFARHIVPVGLSYFLGQSGSVGALYRYLDSEEDRTLHEGILNYSSRLYENSIDHGAVDFGLNIRYERLRWETRDLPLLRTYHHRRIGLPDSSLIDSSWVSAGRVKARRICADVGFFQRNISERLDFGLTLHNVLGYAWQMRKPRINTTRTVLTDSVRATTGDTIPTSWIDSNTYEMAYDTLNGWLDRQYRSLTVGIAFRTDILQNRVHLMIPVDLGIYGLFAREIKTRFSFHGGIEAQMGDGYFVRAGYANAPRFVKDGELASGANLNRHLFTAGGGFKLGPLATDVYLSKDEWGIGATIGL